MQLANQFRSSLTSLPQIFLTVSSHAVDVFPPRKRNQFLNEILALRQCLRQRSLLL